jgi:signal transduction histidine kinase
MSVLSSLTNRIFVATALLVLGAMGVVIYVVNVSVARQAETDLRTGLSEAASLVDQFSRTQFRDFIVKARLIADVPQLKGAASTGDPATVQPIALDYQSTLNADLFVVVGKAGGRNVPGPAGLVRPILARVGRIQVDDAGIEGIQKACRASDDGTCFWPFPGGLLHVVVIPMDVGLETLIVGVSLDRELAEAIKTATNSEVAFVSGSHLVATSLDAAPADALISAAAAADPFNVRIGGDEYIGRRQPLDRSATTGAPIALVLRSRTEHLRFLPELHRAIALTGIVAVLVATLVGYLVARTVTRPLRALTGAMGEMAVTGNLARALPALGRWDDEDVRLVATTFHRLTAALDGFQREASVRERLSSLGRLSTVVAHEIRNPLMIIKSAVRSLRRHPSREVADVATSIDEEVRRLNGVVTGVLDFARPIEFELGPADLAAICRDAAQAARAAADDVPIQVEGGPAPVVTDAERLRSVLINVLTNAQHATRARPAAGASAPPILMRTAWSPSGWRISISDRGAGIDPADLPRIFDPFFTTRRGGSGLGLAIARNIIEGLGGTLAAESRLGEGTTVFIDLPDHASEREVSA